MQLDYETTSLDAVTLVTARLTNDAPVARRVRLRNCLDGPVLPPRTAGVPEAGWDETGYETVVPAESTVAVGYACPAPECDPPLSVVVDERATENRGERAERAEQFHLPSAESVVRRLGRSEPPRDAVPTDGDGFGVDRSREITPSCGLFGSDVTEDGTDESAVASASTGEPSAEELSTEELSTAEPSIEEPSTRSASAPGVGYSASLADLLREAETRIDRAERLTDPSVATATAVLAELGGLDAVDGLQSAVDADAERLRTLADRAETLADRAEATDVSLAALRRLA